MVKWVKKWVKKKNNGNQSKSKKKNKEIPINIQEYIDEKIDWFKSDIDSIKRTKEELFQTIFQTMSLTMGFLGIIITIFIAITWNTNSEIIDKAKTSVIIGILCFILVVLILWYILYIYHAFSPKFEKPKGKRKRKK